MTSDNLVNGPTTETDPETAEPELETTSQDTSVEQAMNPELDSIAEAPVERSWGRRVTETLPTAVALGALIALGVYGHQHGWKIGSSSQTAGSTPAEDWCEAHSVPQSKCLACNPKLAGADPKDWCKEHGVPESKCTICHPEILTGKPAADWCKEHGVPESQCTTCHPEVAVKGTAPASDSGLKISWDAAKLARANARSCRIHLAYVQLASPEVLKKSGISLEQVKSRFMRARLEAYAEVGYDETRIARVATRAQGIVFWVGAQVGRRVERGEVLALVESTDVGQAKAKLLEALAELDLQTKGHKRIAASAKSGLRTKGDLQKAESALRQAGVRLFNARQALENLGLPCDVKTLQALKTDELRQRVRTLGIPAQVAKRLGGPIQTANLIPLRAPLSGVVVDRKVVPGEVLKKAQTTFVVADTNKMWIKVAVPQRDARLVAIKQKLSFRPDDGVSQPVAGEVSWVSTEVDDRTRTVKVRATVSNSKGRLRANVFGRAWITLREAPKAVAVPSDALHWEGCCHLVFVRLSKTVFQPRKVVPGVTQRGYTEIKIGVLPGEVVATRGSHVLKSDLLKSRLGAGCADD